MKDKITSWFKRKGTQPASVQNVQTTPLSDALISPNSVKQSPIKPQQFLSGCAQSNGLQRDHNEDTIFSMNTVLADGKSELPFGIFLVADGMGGHMHGEVASQTAARVVARYLISNVYYKLLDPSLGSLENSLQEILRDAVNEAQRAVLRNAPGGGTTLTCALLVGDHVTIAHLGDSRAYFVYIDGRVQRITQDHSLVQRLVDLEEITEEEAKVHPNRNVLLRALGQSEPINADIQTHQIPRGGTLLLCSDGLWGVVSENEINKVVNDSIDPSLACQKLVDKANDAGGPDNISIILIRFVGE